MVPAHARVVRLGMAAIRLCVRGHCAALSLSPGRPRAERALLGFAPTTLPRLSFPRPRPNPAPAYWNGSDGHGLVGKPGDELYGRPGAFFVSLSVLNRRGSPNHRGGAAAVARSRRAEQRRRRRTARPPLFCFRRTRSTSRQPRRDLTATCSRRCWARPPRSAPPLRARAPTQPTRRATRSAAAAAQSRITAVWCTRPSRRSGRRPRRAQAQSRTGRSSSSPRQAG